MHHSFFIHLFICWRTSSLLPYSSYCKQCCNEQWDTWGFFFSFFQFWFPQGICLGVGLLGYMVVLFLVFKGISIISSIVAVSIYIPTNSARVLPFLKAYPTFIVCRLFDVGHSDWCEVISHCSSDLHFSNNEQCWASFHVFVSYLYVLFGKMFV